MRIERAAAAALAIPALVLVMALASVACRERPLPSVGPGRVLRARADAARSLLALAPDHARTREVFQAQPNGTAGLALLGTGFAPGDVVSFGGRRLETTFGGSRLLTVQVPPDLLARPGEIEVSVEGPPGSERARLTARFHLEPAGSP